MDMGARENMDAQDTISPDKTSHFGYVPLFSLQQSLIFRLKECF